ncbi:MAG: tetratricopeptide repeat protein [Acidobacteriota bacterium]|nr:tetratricopeptide repeat protein [Acidobacteriota bacterium]
MSRKSRRQQQRASARTEIVTAVQSHLRERLLISAALIIAIAIVYAQVATHEFTNFDDPTYVTQNYRVTSGLSVSNMQWAFTTFHANNWHPLTWISHMIDVQLFGLNAGRHLLVNVAIHGLTSVLLFLLLLRLTSAMWPSAAVAALFALHPLHVESVAWVSERKDVLSTLFFVLTLWLYSRFVEKRSAAGYIVMAISFALGLMSKPMLVTLPFVLLLLDYWPLRRLSKQAVIEKLPLVAMVIPVALLTMHAQQESIGAIPLSARFGNAARAYVAYLGKMIWPVHLNNIYSLPRNTSIAITLGAIAFLMIVTIVALRFSKRFPFLTVGWFWYLGTLVPVIGLIQVGRQAMADRYTYIPSIGIFIAVVWAARRWVPVFAIAAIACAVCSFIQVKYWTNSFTLFQHAVAVTPDNDVAHEMLGLTLVERGERAGGERELQKAIDLNATNYRALLALGRLRFSAGRREEAIPLFERALRIKDLPETRAALAAARGNVEEATRMYEEAIRRDPASTYLHNDFAALLAINGRDQQALEQYHEALRLTPDLYDAHMNLGALLSRMDRTNEAIEHFAEAGRAHPRASEPHIYLALAYANAGRLNDAIAEVTTALTIDPVEGNRQFSDAVRMPLKESNLRDYLAFLQQKARG